MTVQAEPQTGQTSETSPKVDVRYCDIVMKGGITSGVVYPPAVVEIAQYFTYKNVGGTSAGAMAAALTAAAERRRCIGGGMAGFDRIAALPAWLGTDKHLFRLFAPNKATVSLYRTIVGIFERPKSNNPALALIAKWGGLVWAYPVASAVGALVGALLLAVAAGSATDGWLRVLEIVFGFIAVVVGATLGFAIALVRDFLTKVPKNSYGLVSGVDDADPNSEVALSVWLAHELERTAGLTVGEAPLTFGMLWDPKRDATQTDAPERPAEPAINLEMISTNLTWGRPYSFPVQTKVFFFDPAELRAFVPAYVVDWMEKHARQPADAVEAAAFATYLPKRPLPDSANLPVILAARMSLSFPILFSAVPLYAVNWNVAVQPGQTPALTRLLFSDGGLSSNFPIGLFDDPLPRWPTFGISLAGFVAPHERSANESENVYVPRVNGAGTLPTFATIDDTPGFVGAIFNSMQNWNDNNQARMPGYRDRVATVFLSDDEGGLNLDMPPDVLDRLRARGTAAGQALVDHFKDPSLGQTTRPPVIDWENQRWVRFRVTLSALKDYLGRFLNAINGPVSPDVTYSTLASIDRPADHLSYPFTSPDVQRVTALFSDLITAAATIDAAGELDANTPRPVGSLSVKPPLDT